MRLRITLGFALLLTFALLAGCAAVMPQAAAPAAPPPQPTAGELTVTALRARPALVDGNGAAFFTILNGLEQEVRLVAAASTVAKNVEIHETIDENGVMRMVPQPDGFAIPAGSSLELKPGGKHIMLLGLTTALEPGASFELTLNFDTGESMALTVPVMEMGAEMPAMPAMAPMHEMTETMEAGMEHMHAMTETMDAHMEHMHAMTETMDAGMEHMHAMTETMDAHMEHMHAMTETMDASMEHMHAMTETMDAHMEHMHALVAALPVAELHAMDEALSAGKLEPGFAAIAQNLLAQLDPAGWPAAQQAAVAELRTQAEKLEQALTAGDAAAAASLAKEIHAQVHELEHQAAP